MLAGLRVESSAQLQGSMVSETCIPITGLIALVQMAHHQFFFELHRVRQKCGLGEDTNDVKVTCIPYMIVLVPEESPVKSVGKTCYGSSQKMDSNTGKVLRKLFRLK